MVFFNYALRKLNAKIVYYGPGLCGKTTNLVWIHDHFEGGERGKMISLATEGDRTIFFDLLPLEIGSIRGMNVTLQLYTVPGQVHYNSTRQLVLRGADGVVFVADSQRAMQSSNIESFRNLQENLLLQGISLEGFPLVLQFNKRDLRETLPTEDLDADLNLFRVPIFEAVATQGVGVQETLEGIVKLVMRSLRERYEGAVAGPRTPGVRDPSVTLRAGAAGPAGAVAGPRAVPPSKAAPPSKAPAPPPPAAPYRPAPPAGGGTVKRPAATPPTQASRPQAVPPRPVAAPPVQPPKPTAPARVPPPQPKPQMPRPAASPPAQPPKPVPAPQPVSRAPVPVAPPEGIVFPEDVGAMTSDLSKTRGPGGVTRHGGFEDEVSTAVYELDEEAIEADPFGPDAAASPFADEPTKAGGEAVEEHDFAVGGGAGMPEFELADVAPPPRRRPPMEPLPGPVLAAEAPEPLPPPPTALPPDPWESDEPVIEFLEPEEDGGALPPVAAPPSEEERYIDRIEAPSPFAPRPAPAPAAAARPPRPALRFPTPEPPAAAAPAASAAGEASLDEVASAWVPEPEPGIPPDSSDLFSLGDGEHFAEGEAAPAAILPSARREVDVRAEDNQLHLRLHGTGAIVESGQVRALDIEVPVPGSWVGNRRVTLQLRLTLTPDSEDGNGGSGGHS